MAENNNNGQAVDKNDSATTLASYEKAGKVFFQSLTDVDRLSKRISDRQLKTAKEVATAEEKRIRDSAKAQEDLLVAKIASEKLFGVETTKHEKELEALRKKSEQDIADLRKNLAQSITDIDTASREKAFEILQKKEENAYKEMDVVKKQQYQEERKRKLSAYAEQLSLNKQIELDSASSDDERAEIRKRYKNEEKALQEQMEDAETKAYTLKIAKENAHRQVMMRDSKQRVALLKEEAKAAKDKVQKLREEKQAEINNATSQEEVDMINAKYQSKEKEAMNEANNASLKSSMADLVSGIQKSFTDALNKIDSYLSVFYTYQASVNARLQGTDTTFQDITKTLKNNLGLSPYVQMKDVVKKIDELADKGIAYNIEQRAFLSSISDKIATTFDAADGTLMRLIRLQQADSTAARLGMEAYLTKFLNNMYEDTSYLSKTFDAVASAILDANSVNNRNNSELFEFTVQKWLGSLSSVGMSDSAVSKIAEGINYLSTGNVGALASNDSLQTLLAMATSRAGLSYGDILTGGLSSSDTNELLREIVEYLQEISSSNNNVVKSEYANLFSMSLSDLTAINNLTRSDLDTIAKTSLTYDQAYSEAQSQLNQVSSRMHIGEKLNNIYENAMTTIGTGIAENAGTYILWKVNEFVENATGGISLPFISAFGNGVDLNATVNQLMKLGIVGVSTISQIGTIVSAVGNAGSMSLDSWGAEAFTSRGGGISGVAGMSVSKGTSESSYVGNSAGSDFENSTIKSATDKAEETSEITNAESNKNVTIETLYKTMYEDNKPVTVKLQNDTTLNVSVKSVENAILTLLANLVGKSTASELSPLLVGDDSGQSDKLLSDLKDILSNGTIKVNVSDVESVGLNGALETIRNS